VRSRLALFVLLAAGCGARTGLDAFADAGMRDAAPPECRVDSQCDDGLDCTVDRCVRGTCERSADDARCDDGQFCTGAGRCDPVDGCVFAGRRCGDGVECTEDTCDEAADTCVSVPRVDRCPLSHRCDPVLDCVARAIVHDDDFLWEVDLPSGAMMRLAVADVPLTDVSLLPDGRLFGVTTDSLFALDETDGSATFVAPLPERSVALDVTPDGDLVSAGISSILRIDPDTGRSTPLAPFPPGFGASGDIAFVRGRMLVATTDRPGEVTSRPDRLFEVPTDGSPAFEVGVIGAACVWGLAPFGDTLYGFTCDGLLLEIDPDTGRGREIARLMGRRIGGAAAR